MTKEFLVSERVNDVLVKGKILGPGESPQQMFTRVVDKLFSIEGAWSTDSAETTMNKELFADFMAEKAVSPGTPTLTNAGRPEYTNAALSSCVVIPVDLRKKDEAAKLIRKYYQQNMGSGFDFTPYEDPVGLLKWLNQLSADETSTGTYDRYIGNMGNLHISHPKISEFIQAKRDTRLPHFNISADVNDEFMNAAIEGQPFVLANGEQIDAHELLQAIAECAHYNGDPGIIRLDRMNRDNPVSAISAYTSTPPCSEMGLAPGEACQFGYLNLAKFVTKDGIDWNKLAQATVVMTRVLDNAVELSSKGYPDPESSRLSNLKRKIGIGVCGLSDALICQGLAYESEEARIFARNLLSFINFTSKVTSVKLAEQRGPCEAMFNRFDNQYYHEFIESRYAAHPTDTVSKEEWETLADYINKTGYLRNILTTALPPTGRASILLGVTSSIEPLFASSGWNEGTTEIINEYLRAHTTEGIEAILAQAVKEGTFQNAVLPGKEILKTAKEISPMAQMQMVAALTGNGGIYDEAASKTINLPNEATVDEVLNIFVAAHQLGLKNISIYRDGSHENQPMLL